MFCKTNHEKSENKDNTDLEKTVVTQDKTIQTKSRKVEQIEIEQINNPKLKVIDIDMDHGGDNEIELDINERNFSNMEGKFKLLRGYTNERTKRKCAIIEVTSCIYKHVKDNKSTLFVGHQSCRVFDIINTTPCKKCVRFGHSSKKCENHLPLKCTSTLSRCANCVYSNVKYNTKYNINHSAIDNELCEILKSKIKKYIEMTDYPMHPTYPRYLSKVESLHIQQKAPLRRGRIASVDSRVSQQSRNAETPPPMSQKSETTTTNQNR